MQYKYFAGQVVSEFDASVLTEAVMGLFDGKSRELKIDTALAKQLTGHSHDTIVEAKDDIMELLVTYGRTRKLVSRVAIDVYRHRDKLFKFT